MTSSPKQGPRARSLARFCVTWALAMGLAVAPASTAEAHAARTVLSTTTFLWLSPSDGAVDGLYSIAYGDVPAQTVRRGADVDRDGSISDVEWDAVVERVRSQVHDCLVVESDGRREEVTLTARERALAERQVAPVWARIELELAIALEPGARSELRVADRCV